MEKEARGVITVFFSLISVFVFGVFFMLIESVRYQGARAQCQNIVDMGHYSTFSEYEKMLLDDFEIFGVDGSYGSGDFSIDRVRDHLAGFMRDNSAPNSDGLISLCFDPWKISQGECKIDEYALLTDDGGENFYQQAVAYMRQTAITTVAGKLLSFYRDAQDAKEKQEQYEKEKYQIEQDMIEAEEKEEEKRKELEEEAAEYGMTLPEQEEKAVNPLPALRRLAKQDLLTILCPAGTVSEFQVGYSDLASARKKKAGNMKLKAPYQGLLNTLYFREYLLDHFGDYRNVDENARLAYEVEYLLCGKRSDRENLKSTLIKLLALREGSNYLYASGDEAMSAECTALASLLIGWTGIPALTAVFKHALLLGWAYAESLLDVRTLMEGGRIPLVKTDETWYMSLDNLAKIDELIAGGGKDRGSGLSYHGYLRILLNLESVSKQKKRGLDLIELRISSASGLSNFKVDHMVVAVRDHTEFTIPPVFSRITGVFMSLTARESSRKIMGGFAYE